MCSRNIVFETSEIASQFTKITLHIHVVSHAAASTAQACVTFSLL